MNSSRRFVARLLCLAVASIASAAPALANPDYNLTVLSGLAGAGYNTALGINNAGAVIGFNTTLDSSTQLYARSSWLRSPGSSALQAFSPPAPYSATVLTSINSSGMVSGDNFDINLETPRGNSVFTWSPTTGTRTLVTPANATSASTSNVNDAGVTVGYVENTPLNYSAVAWDANGQASSLPDTPIGPAIFANRINNNGQILVTGSDGTNRRDYLWDSHTGYAALAAAPGFSDSAGVDLNDAGHAVGYATNGIFSPTGHATFWAGPGHVIDLGVLAGDTTSIAYGINASDMVIGTSGSAFYGSPNRSFLWSASTGMVDILSLIDPHSALLGHIGNLSAYDINDAGQIVGSLVVDGVQQGFLLTPVPEPASIALWLVGLLALGGVMRRRTGA